MPLRIALCQVTDVTDDLASFGRQLGVNSINITFPAIPYGRGYWEVGDLIALRERCESRGLTLEVVENFPEETLRPIVLGLPERDEALSGLSQTIKNLGAAGIPMLGFHFMPNGVWRTTMTGLARGGALTSAYDHSLSHLGNRTGWPQERNTWDGNPDNLVISHERLWENYQYFLDRILPVADEAGVLLAQHPDDPPVSQIDGIARIFTSPDAFSRAEAMAKGSPAWGIDLCLGTVSEMSGAESVHEMIDRFGPAGRIRYVHFRDVKGTVPSFTECFLGEGNYSPSKVIEHLLRVGFTGWLQDDHVPLIAGDTLYAHRARGYEIGYMQGIMSTFA
jgi:mannonate dehydratase